MSIEDKIRLYFKEDQKKRGDDMMLKDIAFECKKCNVHFSPSSERAKRLMTTYSVVSICRECEKGEL